MAANLYCLGSKRVHDNVEALVYYCHYVACFCLNRTLDTINIRLNVCLFFLNFYANGRSIISNYCCSLLHLLLSLSLGKSQTVDPGLF